MPKMVRVILDTNFLMIPLQFKVDIFSEIKRLINQPYELCTYEGVMSELESLAKGNSVKSIQAKATIKPIKQKNLKTLPNFIDEKYADKLILEGVIDSDIVCTQDQALKRLLKNKHEGIQLITLKSKKYLDFD